MNILLEKILKKNGFNTVSEDISIFTNELKSEYFIIENYPKKELINFFESDITGNLIQKFNKLQKNGDNNNIQKNTTLFILVKVENIKNAYTELVNNLILVEEDSYYFRKFVILYTDESLQNLENMENLQDMYKLLDKDINNFEKDMFFNDTYYVAMELLIKLPFFKIKNSNNKYLTIEETYRNEKKDEIDNRLLDIFSEDRKYVDILSNVESTDSIIEEIFSLFNVEE
ncbi:ABC-three component system middle component 1 [Vagococcus hydrophili]|uniref:Uncharacterized protein n=1 Tax=Vagococcus hydrophili TaxID=2714947 RepID=A0A6G8AVI1_9ENTE|nr:ABC-three component system middle component 1 [Vagococcus hydrophili]QIL48945.1 hypothetical protein G7082_10725 [Vagococcus hydrophili]